MLLKNPCGPRCLSSERTGKPVADTQTTTECQHAGRCDANEESGPSKGETSGLSVTALHLRITQNLTGPNRKKWLHVFMT